MTILDGLRLAALSKPTQDALRLVAPDHLLEREDAIFSAAVRGDGTTELVVLSGRIVAVVTVSEGGEPSADFFPLASVSCVRRAGSTIVVLSKNVTTEARVEVEEIFGDELLRRLQA